MIFVKGLRKQVCLNFPCGDTVTGIEISDSNRPVPCLPSSFQNSILSPNLPTVSRPIPAPPGHPIMNLQASKDIRAADEGRRVNRVKCMWSQNYI